MRHLRLNAYCRDYSRQQQPRGQPVTLNEAWKWTSISQDHVASPRNSTGLAAKGRLWEATQIHHLWDRTSVGTKKKVVLLELTVPLEEKIVEAEWFIFFSIRMKEPQPLAQYPFSYLNILTRSLPCSTCRLISIWRTEAEDMKQIQCYGWAVGSQAHPFRNLSLPEIIIIFTPAGVSVTAMVLMSLFHCWSSSSYANEISSHFHCMIVTIE